MPLIEIQYLPNIGYLSLFATNQTVVLDDTESFGRQSYRNRALIVGANGIMPLIIPVEEARRGLPIREVRIAQTKKWQREHWQSLKSAYGKSSFFEFYADAFQPLYIQKFDFLWDADMAFLKILLKLFKLPNDSIRLHSELTGEVEIESLKEHFHPKKPLPYLSEPYPQTFMEKHGFSAGLSSIDVLFNAGTSSWLPAML